MRMRWVVAMFLGLALLTGQVVSLTMGPLTVGHVPPVFAYDNPKSQGQGGGDGLGQGVGNGNTSIHPGQHEGTEK